MKLSIKDNDGLAVIAGMGVALIALITIVIGGLVVYLLEINHGTKNRVYYSNPGSGNILDTSNQSIRGKSTREV